MPDPLTMTAVATTLFGIVRELTATTKSARDDLKQFGKDVYSDVSKLHDNALDLGRVSLTSYTKPLQLNSRVYIDQSVAADDIITDIIKTVHTQYAGLILSALQLNTFVTKGVSVRDMLKVVATESVQPHLELVAGMFGDVDMAYNPKPLQYPGLSPAGIPPLPKKDPVAAKKPEDPKVTSTDLKGEIKSYAGDNHIPAGKILEVTLTNPENPEAKQTVNLWVQMSPYIVPEPLAVAFIAKDAMPTFYQRYIQWSTGEISFWKDLILWDDIVKNREKLRKLDPTGTIAADIDRQNAARVRVVSNLQKKEADRARNIANAVLVFSAETVRRAQAQGNINLTDPKQRQAYFDTTFAMIIVMVDPMFNQVTFYYNGIDDAATFSYDQLEVKGKKSGGIDLVSVMNALGQGRAPRF